MEEIELNSDELKNTTVNKLDGNPKIGWFCNKNGLLLKTYGWVVKNAVGIIYLIHGLSTHARLTFMRINIKLPTSDGDVIVDNDNYYIYKDSWIEKFNQNGYSVYALDLQGHGESQAWNNIRGSANRFDDLVDDVIDYMNHIQDEIANENQTDDESYDVVPAKKKRLPMYIIGHSMGGGIAIRILQLLRKEKEKRINSGDEHDYKKCNIMLDNSTNANEINNDMVEDMISDMCDMNSFNDNSVKHVSDKRCITNSKNDDPGTSSASTSASIRPSTSASIRPSTSTNIRASTSANTNANMRASTSANTSTNMRASTSANTSTNIRPSTSANTNANMRASTSANTSTNIRPSTSANTNANMRASTSANTNANMRASTSANTNANMRASTSANTNANMRASTSANTSTNIRPSTSANTNANTSANTSTNIRASTSANSSVRPKVVKSTSKVVSANNNSKDNTNENKIVSANNNSKDNTSENTNDCSSDITNASTSESEQVKKYNNLDELNIRGCVSLSGMLGLTIVGQPESFIFKYIYIPVTKLMSYFAPYKKTVAEFPYKTSQFIENVFKYDKLRITDGITYKYLHEIIKTMGKLFDNAKNMPKDIPLLLVHSKDDGICNYKGSQSYFDKIDVPGKELYIVEGLNHSTTLESGNEDVLQKVMDWINSRNKDANETKKEQKIKKQKEKEDAKKAKEDAKKANDDAKKAKEDAKKANDDAKKAKEDAKKANGNTKKAKDKSK
ncbi:lysophospholipase, putative [Plasmodium vinckei petteri]|uniref:Lysophospholipase, putative n=1 Tax=Plasmodium vinckei petteri TaxID=138298 RepID=A0A6V7SRL1_PLAVN|nr:lysophospholipase, putative [Plasmodium vinckei petteri]